MPSLLRSKRPLVLPAASLLGMCLLLTLTSPASNLGVGLAFFALLLVFMISTGYLLLWL